MVRKWIDWFGFLVFALLASALSASGACVWKVTDANGHTLYLGGSIHRLRSTDYPLPAAYNRAFDASARLAGEVDDRSLIASSKSIAASGYYAKGDGLERHVDPRTYAYLKRVFGIMRLPESIYSRMKPWLLVLFLQSVSQRDYSDDLGVESFLFKRAKANSKPITGLESMREHAQVFSGLSDRQGEALLLLTFIPPAAEKDDGDRLMKAWRRGDADEIHRMTSAGFRDFPSFESRLLDARNRNWIPKLEGYLRSGQTYFVIVGAAHMGGPQGLLALLRARGYKIEQW